MGGKAFLEVLSGATFPRMTPQIYQTLKALHLEQLKGLFHLVGVPREAPEKTSHGDLDFVVFSPVDRLCPEDIKHTIGATHCITDSDASALNLAVPMEGGDASNFYQVDINQCRDEDEWGRTIFFHGYGDLGMIMGLVARANGLSLGLHGLKVPHAPEFNMAPFLLSSAFPRIFDFFDLDLASWEAGFPSLQSAFQWVASSRLFDPQIVKESPHREHRRNDREMYQMFLIWMRDQRLTTVEGSACDLRPISSSDKVVEEAKVFFGKKQEYDGLVEKERKRRKIKDTFNGHLVMEWTGLRGIPVRELMDEVRARMDEETIHRSTREEMKARVLDAQERMALHSEDVATM